MVALGYSQVPGVDFKESFSPVASDVTIKVVFLLLFVMTTWVSLVVDVDTAFLNGKLKETIYMKLPEGLDQIRSVAEDQVAELLGTIYGLGQSARVWYDTLVKVLIGDLGLKCFELDTCLLYKKSALGVVIICVYVDDMLMIGNQHAIDEVVEGLKKKFSLKILGKLEEYVGCKVLTDVETNEHWLYQPDLLRKMRKTFSEEVEKMQVYSTPLPAGTKLARPQEDDAMLDWQKQTRYRSGVGMLLYLVKLTRPDLCNPVRELSKMMDGANEGHYNMLMRVIKYTLDTEHKCLRFTPKFREDEGWELKVFCDSDFASDKNSRISVSGFIIYLCGVAISWKSKGQRSVTLSSTEAEYVAISEVVREVLYLRQLLEFLGVILDYPVIVHVDNLGAIYLAGGNSSTQRTKHVDIRYHFVREYIEDGIVKVKFVRSEDNDSDVFTKNLSGELLDKHAEKFMEVKLE